MPRAPAYADGGAAPRLQHRDGSVHATPTGAPEPWVTVEGSFALLLAMNLAWQGTDLCFGPYACVRVRLRVRGQAAACVPSGP